MPGLNFKSYTRTDLVTWKGKWELKGSSKIELHFIGECSDIGLQKGKYSISENKLVVKTQGVHDFAYLELYR